jgi:hypothetical protein
MIKMNWNGYARYYDWEFDLICTNQRKDVNLWLKLAERFGDFNLDPVKEDSSNMIYIARKR